MHCGSYRCLRCVAPHGQSRCICIAVPQTAAVRELVRAALRADRDMSLTCRVLEELVQSYTAPSAPTDFRKLLADKIAALNAAEE